MISLTKLNNEVFIINCNQIECIEMIPESKVILMNKDFFIVKETADQIIDKIIEFNAKINHMQRKIVVINQTDEVDF